MAICVTVLTVAHPGLTLGTRWNAGQFHWSSKKNQALRTDFGEESSETSGRGHLEGESNDKEGSLVQDSRGMA